MKTLLRFVLRLSLFFGLLALIAAIVNRVRPPLPQAASIGIIGGADGPTVIYTANTGRLTTFFLGLASLCASGFMRLRRAVYTLQTARANTRQQ